MILLDKVSFAYRKNDPLFVDLSLALESGGVCGLLGKNGAGKSTLLKLLAGLVFPKSGECKVFDEEPGKRQPSILADMFLIGEEFYLPALTMSDYEKLYAPFYPAFDHSKLRTLIKEYDLNDKKLLTEFSYGQKKKFLITFGLASNCRLLLLDEPTNGFDIPSKSQFRQMISSNISDDRLFIISTHQVHDVQNLIDKIVVLDQGKVIFDTTMNDLSRRLNFDVQNEKPAIDECIYFQKQLGKYIVVRVNKDDQESEVDLEILFSALLQNQEKLQQLMKEGV